MLPVSLDCPFLMAPCFVCLCPVSCVSNVASVSGLYILDGPLFCLSLSCVLCRHWQHEINKTQDKDKQNKGPSRMYNPETLATLDTQDTGQRQIKQGAIKNVQSRDTGNIRYTRHRTKTNKTRGNQEWTILSCVSNVASASGLYILDGPLFCLSLSCVLCI
jgi:hypothetical protein